MTLRTRFALLIGVAVGLSIAGFSTALLLTEKRHLARETDRQRIEEIRKLALLCRESRLSQDEIGLMNYLRIMTGQGALWALFMAPDGKVLAHASPVQRGRLLSDPMSARAAAASGPLRQEGTWENRRVTEYDFPVEGPKEHWGVARAAYDTADNARRLAADMVDSVRRFAGVGLAALLGGLLLAWVTADRLSAPLHRLAQGAARIGGGDLSVRVPKGAPGEIGLLSHAFNRMAEDLGRLDALKDSFIQTVSHDLRNPLGAIQMSARLILTESRPGPSDKKLLSVIVSSADRLGAMVGNILDLAKIKERRMTYDRKAVPPKKLLDDALALYQATARSKDISLTARVAKGLPPVDVDEEKIHRVLTNLISNAFKFTRRDGEIHLSAVPAGDPSFVEFSVADSGVGISAQGQAALFQKFSSVPDIDPAFKSAQGTGLGLAIVKVLVEGHGGTVRVVSAPGRGAAFFWTLPAARQGDPA